MSPLPTSLRSQSPHAAELAGTLGRTAAIRPGEPASPTPNPPPESPATPRTENHPPADSTPIAPELARSLAEVKAQAQFLLYLAEQVEDALHQLAAEEDPGHASFLCRILAMYSGQLETKHQGLGDRIAETCQEIYVTVREHDLID